MGMGMGMWFDGNKVTWNTFTSSSAKVTGTIKAPERDREKEHEGETVGTELDSKEEKKRKS